MIQSEVVTPQTVDLTNYDKEPIHMPGAIQSHGILFVLKQPQSAKYVTYEVRNACELLAQVMSLELASKENNEDVEYKMELKSIQSQFIESIQQSENLVSGLVKDKSNLLDLVSAEGVALCSDGQLTVIGKTPGEANIQELIEWVKSKSYNDVFLQIVCQKLNQQQRDSKMLPVGC